MTEYAGWDHGGSRPQGHPEIAARAVADVHQQSPSPVYGYLRTGTQQKIYLFQALQEAIGWISPLLRGQAQPYDYVAVFAATDLERPIPGMEGFGVAGIDDGTQVGAGWPFFLGLPVGLLGGYYLRKWQEAHPGRVIPGIPPGALPDPNLPVASKVSGGPWLDIEAGHAGYAVGGPWLDVEDGYPGYDVEGAYPGHAVGGPWLDVEDGYPGYAVGGTWLDVEGAYPGHAVGGPWLDVEDGHPGHVVGGPWLDVVGAQAEDSGRMRGWPLTKALIQTATKEVTEAAAEAPAEAYVWSLDPPSEAPSAHITLEGTTTIVTFPSPTEALDYLRSRIQTPHVALALFDRRSPHWPNPINWTKSRDEVNDSVIAQYVARGAQVRAAGDHVGADLRLAPIDAVLADVRSRAQTVAAKREGAVVGVVHTAKDGRWHAYAFRSTDDADDWLGTATQDPTGYTYAAYFNKDDYLWPRPLNEKIGGSRARSRARLPKRRGVELPSGTWGG